MPTILRSPPPSKFIGPVYTDDEAGAVVEGIGVRVVVDHRQGYAWAGSLEPAVIEETLRDARDNAAFGEADEREGSFQWRGGAAFGPGQDPCGVGVGHHGPQVQ